MLLHRSYKYLICLLLCCFGSCRAWFLSRRAVQKTILSRRTINDIEPTLPRNWEKTVESGVEAAVYAPNHKRTEPWKFYLLGQQSIQKVCELNAKLITEKKGEAAGAKKLKRWLAMPGWMVVTCQKREGESMDDPMSLAREDYAACCCAVQNFCLTLHANGIGTKWTTGAVNFDEDFGKAAGISANEYVVGTIWFGKAATVPSPPKKKPLDEVFLHVA